MERPKIKFEREFPGETSDVYELAKQLKEIDERHGLKTERGIEEYAEAFDVTPEELIEGRVLNIGDPFIRLPADFPNVISLDYFYGTDVRPRIRELKEKRKLTPQEEKELGIYEKWVEVTTQRIEKGVEAVKGVFPMFPFKNESFDRVLSLNAISMHPFDEKGGFTEEEWEMWWGEILRVLKPGGKAFIGPFDRLSEHETMVMERKLKAMKEEGRLSFKIGFPEILEGYYVARGPDYVIIEKPEVKEK